MKLIGRHRMMGLCCVILIGSIAQSQSIDWQSVKRIHPGTRISVKTRLRSICDFIIATDETLVCEAAHRRTDSDSSIPARAKQSTRSETGT